MACVRCPVLAVHEVAVDENLAAGQTETEDFIRHREVVSDVVDVLLSAQSLSPFRVCRDPLDELLLRNDDAVPDFQLGKRFLMQQFICRGLRNAEYLREHLRVEEKRELIVDLIVDFFIWKTPPSYRPSSFPRGDRFVHPFRHHPTDRPGA